MPALAGPGRRWAECPTSATAQLRAVWLSVLGRSAGELPHSAPRPYLVAVVGRGDREPRPGVYFGAGVQPGTPLGRISIRYIT